MPLGLVRPAARHLPGYVEALRRGWSPGDVARERAAREHREAIARDPGAFLAGLDDPEGRGRPVTLPDGSVIPRLPGFRRWMWDEDDGAEGGFCGIIDFRWRPGTPELPPQVLGHIGYEVVPWRRGRGHATRALALLLAEIAGTGLPYVELTTEPENPASVRVIEANGGVLVERFTKGPAYGGGPGLRFRIALPRPQRGCPARC